MLSSNNYAGRILRHSVSKACSSFHKSALNLINVLQPNVIVTCVAQLKLGVENKIKSKELILTSTIVLISLVLGGPISNKKIQAQALTLKKQHLLIIRT